MHDVDQDAAAESLDWREIHTNTPVCNIHYDWSLEVARRRQAGEQAVLETHYLPQLEAGAVDFDFMTVGGDHRHFCGADDLADGSLIMLDHMLADLAESSSFVLATQSQDIIGAKQSGQRAIMLTIEGSKPIKEDLWRLRTLYRLGVRSIILTWFTANAVADGVNEARSAGLTDFGRDVVREMNRLGMLIDISQSTAATFDDVVHLTEQPIIASHSNAAGVFAHRRNLTDAQLEQIARLEGVVGVHTFASHLASEGVNLETLLDHIDHIVRTIGEDYVALGLNITVEPDGAVDMFQNSKIDYGNLYIPGIESMAQFGNITLGLLRRGYSTTVIDKILGGNFLRVVRAVVG